MGVVPNMISTTNATDFLPVKRARSASPVSNFEDLSEHNGDSQAVKRPTRRFVTTEGVNKRTAWHEEWKEEVLQYLTAVLKLRPDFDIYEKSKGHGFHGPTLLRIYQFAVDFMDKYKDQYTLTSKVHIKFLLTPLLSITHLNP
jgi:hypothetical protein